MDAENLLISKIIRTGDLRPVLDAKITGDFFLDQEHREVFLWVIARWKRYGSVPAAQTLKTFYPEYRIPDGPEPYDVYIDLVRERRRYELTFRMLAQASRKIEDDDPDGALSVIQSQVTRIHTEVSELRDTNLMETGPERLERYEDWRKYGDRLRGIPSGFPTIDRILRGFQPEQLVTFVGVHKTGKSTLLLRMALEAHQAGYEPLFIGFEMSNEEQEARYDSMRAGVSYPLLLEGKLPRDQREKLAREIGKDKGMQPFILSSDPEGATVGGIAAKIEQYRPHVVFLDGVYLMDDEDGAEKGTPLALTNITRSLKKLAQRTKTPIVITTQALLWKMGKKGLHTGAIGYASSFAQDSDVIMGVEHTGDDEESPIKKVSVLDARSAPRKHVLISWDWETGTFEELDGSASTGQWSLEDEDPEEEPKPRRRLKRVS